MSFVSNALGISNGFSAASAAGPNGQITRDPSLLANAQAANANYGAVNTNQSELAKQLLAQSQGQGPNIANLQLQQATNQNNQQAAGAAASQRGMNPALAQRMALQQQSMNNQNAAGQSGVLRAQQQLAAQQGLANVYGQQAGEANQNMAGNYAALGNENNAVVGAVNAANQANAQIAQNNANQNAGITSGIMNGVGSMMQMFAAKGGEVPHMFQGGDMLSNFPTNAIDPGLSSGPSASANNLFGATSKGSAPSVAGQGGGSSAGGGGGGNPLSGMTSMFGGSSGGGGGAGGFAGSDMGSAGEGAGGFASMVAAHGGEVPVVLSPGELKIPAHLVDAVAKGKVKASQAGERIPGKAKVKGDNLKNDTYATHANAGDVIIKRTKAQNDDDAREFLLAIKADKEKKSGPSGYSKILEAKRKNAR